jgi:hypothetical protein
MDICTQAAIWIFFLSKKDFPQDVVRIFLIGFLHAVIWIPPGFFKISHCPNRFLQVNLLYVCSNIVLITKTFLRICHRSNSHPYLHYIGWVCAMILLWLYTYIERLKRVYRSPEPLLKIYCFT